MESEPPLILVVDDSEEIRELFQLTLERAGYQVRVAADGREGLQAVRERRPDLILSDISMPGMDGFEFLVHLRSDFAPPLPPVVVISGFDATAEEALRLGAIRFVAKPVEVATLMQIVEQALRGLPADEATLAHERALVQAARERAANAAARLFATLQAYTAALERVLPIFAQWVSDYFGFASAGVFFVEGSDSIRMAGVSRGSLVPAGTSYSGGLLFATGVLASGSSLVVADAASRFGAAVGEDERFAKLALKFVVAVPLLFDDVPIGSICLFDRAAHPFEAEDLRILEGIGRYASQYLRERVRIGKDVGLVSPELFDHLLGAELSMLHREKGGLELLLVEIDPAAVGPTVLEIESSGGTRLAICRREPGTLAIYKRERNPAAARSTISASLSTLVATDSVRAAGWVSVVDAALPPVPRDIVFRLAELALEQSRGTPARRIEPLLLGRESKAGDVAAASAPPSAG